MKWSVSVPVYSFLAGLHALLHFYVPALFVVGHNVRRLYWEGRPGDAVTGALAHRVLLQCLNLHVHLQGDWLCRAEYTRTLSVALLGWQPYLLSLIHI